MSLQMLRDADGEPEGMLAQFKLLPDGLSNDEKLRLYLRIIEDSNQGVMVSDAQERIVVVNAAFTRITGYTVAEVAGQFLVRSAGREQAADRGGQRLPFGADEGQVHAFFGRYLEVIPDAKIVWTNE